MAGLTTTYNVCPGCGAGVGARATACALCDTPLPRAARRSASQRTPQAPDALPVAKQRVWRELAMALSPAIRVVGYLDEGGMGSVFLGYDVSLKREVAIKVLATELAEDSTARARFKREAEAAGGVSHPNVVAVHQVGELPTSHAPYFVMQFVEGPTLQHAVHHHRMLSESRVRRILGDVAAGLAAAHRRGVVHRDIKPTNVVLDAETGRALVLDFGIAAALDARRSSASMRLTTEGMYLGTPMYMSPEQAGSGELTDRSDIYSLAVVAFELLTGRPPFTGSNPVTLMAAHLKEAAPRVDSLRADVSPELAMLLGRCLSKDPLQRPSSQALVDFFDPDAASTIAWPPPGLERGRGAGARFVGVLALLGAVMLGFFVMLHRWPGELPGADGDRTLLGLAAVVVFMLLGMTIGTGARVARIAARGRRAGYPWPVVAETLADRWVDTEALVNGRGVYALSDAAVRHRFLRLRRAQGVLGAAGTVLALVAPVAWLFWPRAGSGDATTLVTGGELAAIFVAPVLLAGAALLCAVPEARWRRHNAMADTSGVEPQGVREELVRGWLQVSRRGFHSPSRGVHRPAIVASLVLLCGAIAATVALALFAVILSSTLVVQGRATATVNPATFADVTSAAAHRAAGDSSDSAVERAQVPMRVASGVCMNARELLFGPDARRLALVVDIRRSMRDGDAAAARNAQLAERWLATPSEFGRGAQPVRTGSGYRTEVSRPLFRTLGALGLAGVRERFTYCTRLVRE